MTQFVVPTPPPIGTCSGCRFWESADIQGDDGRCHYRAPPTPQSVGGKTIWPRTAFDDWCGSFEERPAVRPAPAQGGA